MTTATRHWFGRPTLRGPAALFGSRAGWIAASAFALVAAGHALGTFVVYEFDHTPSTGVSFFPADGVTLAAYLLLAPTFWPVVAAATFASEFVSDVMLHERIITCFGLALSNTLGPMLGAWLVLRVLGHRPRLEDGRDLAVLFVGGVVVGPLFDALTGPPFARLTTSASPYLETIARWWTGDALGALIVGMLILAWLPIRDWSRPTRARAIELCACAAILVGISVGVSFVWKDTVAYLVLIPLGWAALRFGMRGATTATLVVMGIAEWATVTGHGQFAAETPDNQQSALWRLQLFLFVAAGAALVCAAEVARARRAEQARQVSERAEREARQATLEARAAERSRLSRELHDSVSQALFASSLHARSAQKQLARAGLDSPKLTSDLNSLRELTSAALAEMRALIFELRPDALVQEGLVAALQRQADATRAQSGLTVTVTGPSERLPLDPAAEEHLYRIALEAAHNAVKHAQATMIDVHVSHLGDAVELMVTDNGIGFDPTRGTPGHLGLETMRERAVAAGATLDVIGRPGAGTSVCCRVVTAQETARSG
jgi:signal transduction histidine kinase